MDFIVLSMSVVNFLGLIIIALVFLKGKQRYQDDPRLSRGLQLLQAKLSVLEDLSDQTERQVEQTVDVLDRKALELEKKIHDADNCLREIQISLEKSLEVVEIFQDRIPHREIIERQNTINYVKAACLAHEGKSVEQIVESVGINREEAEFISKVNQRGLVFSKEDLPQWIHSSRLDFEENGEQPLSEFAVEGLDRLAKRNPDFLGTTQVERENVKELERQYQEAKKHYQQAQNNNEHFAKKETVESSSLPNAASHQGLDTIGTAPQSRLKPSQRIEARLKGQEVKDYAEGLHQLKAKAMQQSTMRTAKPSANDKLTVKKVVFPSLNDQRR